MSAIVIWTPNRNPWIKTVDKIDLEMLQAIVGGYIEMPFAFEDIDAVIHEEGRFHQDFLTFCKPWMSLPIPSDLRDYPASVFGPMVFCYRNSDGDSKTLSEAQAEWVITHHIPKYFTYEAIS